MTMTKKKVLEDISKLCEDLDNCIWDICKAAQNRNIEALNEANVDASRLIICAHQELSFLMDYIDENVK